MTQFRASFDRPILLVSTPRSGSTLAFETLAQAPGLFTTGQESHWLIEDVPGLAPEQRDWSSNRLTSEDATDARCETISSEFYRQSRDREGGLPSGRIRLLEKTPKNALRVPFFATMWPDSLFVYLYRDVRETLASMIEAWASGAFRTYPELPGWSGCPWSLLLVPGWENLAGRPLPEIVARQWAATTEILVADLEALPPDRVRVLSYSQLRSAPQQAVAGLAGSLGLGWDRTLGASLPLSKTTVSPPREDKWRRLEAAIEQQMAVVAEAEAKALQFMERLSALQPNGAGAPGL